MSKKTQQLQPRMSQTGPFTVEASGYEPVDGETIPRRHPGSKDKLVSTPSEDVTTIFDILKRSADKFGNAKALGSRKLIKTHHETKKVKKTVDGKTVEVDKDWSFFELSGYSFISFSEYERIALQMGAGLRKLGMIKGDRLQLFAGTRSDFVFSSCRSIFLTKLHFTVPTGLPCHMVQYHSQCRSPQHMIHWEKKD